MTTNSQIDVMGLLRSGIPLTLLMDLADPAGPPSLEILESERRGGLVVL